MSHRDYETLVAAHVLRSPDFAATYGPLLSKVDGRFFGDLFTREVVLYSLNYFNGSGRLLPKEALKADATLYASNGTSQANFDRAIDFAFQIPDQSLESSRDHVKEKLVSEVQCRLLLAEDLHSLCSPADLAELWSVLDEIKTLGADQRGGARRLSEGLLESMRTPPPRTPVGLGGITVLPGETVLLFGRYGIGKSIAIHHVTRYLAEQVRTILLWSFETSEWTTRLRLFKGFLNWTEEQIREQPDLAYDTYIQTTGDLPLFIRYDPPGSVTSAQIREQLDRIEQQISRKVDVLAMDYSEKRAKGRDWNQVCDAYEELRVVCGERQMIGLDVAQENSSGSISYFNLLKDADIGVQLTLIHPDEWRRKQRSRKDQDAEEIKIPTQGPVYGEIIRAREDESGRIFQLWVDRSVGRMEPRIMGAEED